MTTYEEIYPLFVSNPLEAIEKCQELICSVTGFNSYKEFYKYHQQHPRMSTCQEEWSDRLAMHCYDCANTPSSCVCLECFLKGNHEGHDYIIRPKTCGNCDCGDLSMWKRSGFCNNHHGVEENTSPEDYLDSKLRQLLTDVIFKAAFNGLLQLKTDEDSKISAIVNFISSFLPFGDGFRRLIVITFTEKVGSKNIFSQIFDASEEFNKQLEKLCGGLVNDDVFRCRISSTVSELMIQRILPEDFKFSENKNKKYSEWDHFWFHSFSKRPIEYNIKELGWDWVTFTLQFSELMKKNFAFLGKVPLSYTTPSYIVEVATSIPLARSAQTDEQTQLLFDELFTKVLNCGSEQGQNNDNVVVASFLDEYQELHYRTLYSFKITYYDIMNVFKFKKELKIDKLFDELEKRVNITPIFCIGRNVVGNSCDSENEKFVLKFLMDSIDSDNEIEDYYYKSFHNGASFFYSLPLYDSLVRIFNIDNMNRVKVSKILSTGKFQSLRIKLGIITLKNILSYLCLHQSLTPKNNHSLIIFMQILLKTSCLSLSLPMYFPLFQLLLGLQCNDSDVVDEFSLKEFFAFEMAREIGIFDDFEGEEYLDEEAQPLKEQMTFTILYLAILTVIERNLFNFSSYNFIEEQIILALKSGVSQLEELNKSFDSDIDPHFRQFFNKIISEVATTNRNSEKKDGDDMNKTSFFLKKGVEWKTISALNQLNTQKVILEKEISKNPNKLLQIPDFEPEESYFFHPPRGYKPPNDDDGSIDQYDIDSTGLNIKLKEFLFTPTIIALVYQTLRDSSDVKITLNEHLAMMILVLVSRFAKENDDGNNKDNSIAFDESTVIQYDSSIYDLITKLKEIVFGSSIDEKDGNAKIKNNLLGSKSFNSFINLKIGPPYKEPKSFVEILLEKGETGKNVLSQMSVDISKYGIKDSGNELSKEQLNKKRANKLKSEIMDQYKSAISNYNFFELDQLDENPSLSTTIGDTCSICSTIKKDQILSYTVYMYRTKIPFAFDKPPMVKYNPRCEVPVDDDLLDLLFDDDEKQKIKEENNDEEEDEEPNLNEVLDSLSDPQTQEELQMYYFMRNIILSSFREKLQSFYSKKVKRQYKQKLLRYEEEVVNSEAFKKGISDTERMVTAGNNFVLQFGICQHPVHPSCVNEKVFTCPIDRSRRNGFLPALDGIKKQKIFKDFEACHEVREDTLTDEMKECLQNFMTTYSSFFEKTDIFIELIKSISSLISTFEVRLRSLPDCLDSEKNKILSRNLFLTAWYLYRMCGKPKMSLGEDVHAVVDERLTSFQKLVKRLIECDELVQPDNNSNYTEHMKKVFMGIVSSFVKSPDFSTSSDPLRKEKEVFLFLKRACLADHFLLNNMNVSSESEFSSLLDWDEILSVSNLSEYYKVDLGSLSGSNGEEFEFRPFIFCRLPKELLLFAKKPYSFKIDCMEQFVLFNIIDYNYLISHHDDFSESELNDDDEEIKKNQKNVIVFNPEASSIRTILITMCSRCVYPSFFLSIAKSSSEVVILNEQVLGNMKPFYLDRFGCEDQGYKRGMPLFLNEERFERVIDEILSGEFSFCFS